MSKKLSQEWRISEEAIANTVGDEVVILHLGNRTYFGLDSIGVEFWNGIKSNQRPDQIAASIARRHEIEPEQVNKDILEFMNELIANGLIVPAGSE